MSKSRKSRARRSLGWCSRLVILLAAMSLPGATLAEGPNQAALVIQFDSDRVETRCLSFDGDTITGQEMLARSGLDVLIDATRGMGITVCRIEGVGCNFPTEHCFCQCMGSGNSGCAYWNYFYRDPGSGSWVYSPLGATLHKARPGSVEAWVWGDGHTPPPADLTFETICAVPTAAIPTPTLQLKTEAPASPTPLTPKATLTPTATPTSTATPTTWPTASPPPPTATLPPTSGPHTTPDLASYWPLGLFILVLAIIGAVARLRHT